MKNRRAISVTTSLSFFALVLVVLMPPKFTQTGWRKVSTPPDVDKTTYNQQNTLTCWYSDDAEMQ